MGVLRAIDDGGDILEPDRRAILVGNNDGLVTGAGQDLIVGTDGVGLSKAVEIAFGLVDIGLAERRADIFQAKSVSGKRAGVDADSDGRLLAAANALRDLRQGVEKSFARAWCQRDLRPWSREQWLNVRARVRIGASAGLTLL